MFDVLQVVFWSITYVLIIIAGFQSRVSRKVSIPYLASVQNFTWELCALVSSSGFWAHIIWFALDGMIVLFCFLFLDSKKKKWIYLASIAVGIILFGCVFTTQNGMLYSSFVIDLLMAVYFLLDRQKLSPKLKIPIAITKLLGDTFAGIYYAPSSYCIAVCAVLVFICNVSYLCLCIIEIRKAQRKAISES